MNNNVQLGHDPDSIQFMNFIRSGEQESVFFQRNVFMFRTLYGCCSEFILDLIVRAFRFLI
jgi:hypothetical protein